MHLLSRVHPVLFLLLSFSTEARHFSSKYQKLLPKINTFLLKPWNQNRTCNKPTSNVTYLAANSTKESNEPVSVYNHTRCASSSASGGNMRGRRKRPSTIKREIAGQVPARTRWCIILSADGRYFSWGQGRDDVQMLILLFASAWIGWGTEADGVQVSVTDGRF